MDKTTVNYLNEATGEITTSHNEAMNWYRNGYEVGVWSWSEVCQSMIERVAWVH